MTNDDELYSTIKTRLHSLLLRGKAEQLARALNIPKSTLSNWRNINRSGIPNLIEAYRLTKAMKISLYDLVDPHDRHMANTHPTIAMIVDLCASLKSQQLSQLHELIGAFLILSDSDKQFLKDIAMRFSDASLQLTQSEQISTQDQYDTHVAAESPASLDSEN